MTESTGESARTPEQEVSDGLIRALANLKQGVEQHLQGMDPRTLQSLIAGIPTDASGKTRSLREKAQKVLTKKTQPPSNEEIKPVSTRTSESPPSPRLSINNPSLARMKEKSPKSQLLQGGEGESVITNRPIVLQKYADFTAFQKQSGQAMDTPIISNTQGKVELKKASHPLPKRAAVGEIRMQEGMLKASQVYRQWDEHVPAHPDKIGLRTEEQLQGEMQNFMAQPGFEAAWQTFLEKNPTVRSIRSVWTQQDMGGVTLTLMDQSNNKYFLPLKRSQMAFPRGLLVGTTTNNSHEDVTQLLNAKLGVRAPVREVGRPSPITMAEGPAVPPVRKIDVSQPAPLIAQTVKSQPPTILPLGNSPKIGEPVQARSTAKKTPVSEAAIQTRITEVAGPQEVVNTLAMQQAVAQLMQENSPFRQKLDPLLKESFKLGGEGITAVQSVDINKGNVRFILNVPTSILLNNSIQQIYQYTFDLPKTDIPPLPDLVPGIRNKPGNNQELLIALQQHFQILKQRTV